jgi:hypothetical protein
MASRAMRKPQALDAALLHRRCPRVNGPLARRLPVANDRVWNALNPRALWLTSTAPQRERMACQ